MLREEDVKMPQRYCVCPVELMADPLVGGQSYKPRVALYTRTYAAVSDDTHGWALCVFRTDNLGPVVADPLIELVPDATLDMSVGSVHKPIFDAWKAKLVARGIDVSGLNGTDGMRDYLQKIGRTLQPAFDVDKLNVL